MPSYARSRRIGGSWEPVDRVSTLTDYPINGSELARLLLHDQSRVREYTREDYKFVQDDVRAKLKAFDCPKTSSSDRANWAVDEDMANRVAEALGMSLY